MRSPRHLVATVLVVGALVLTVGLIVPRLTGSNRPSGAAANLGATSTTTTRTGTPGAGSRQGSVPGAGQNPTSTPTTSLPTRPTAPAQTPTSAPPSPKAMDTATAWAKAWVTHPQGVTTEQWLNGLKPYTTEERLSVTSTVDPRN